MSIISCVVCGKKISSKAASCSHCGANFKEGGVENLESVQMMESLKKFRKLQTFSFLAVITFIVGSLMALYEDYITSYLNKNFGWEFALGGEMLSVAKYIMALGFVGYIVCRFMVYFNKKKKSNLVK